MQWLAAVELALLKGRHPSLDTISLRSELEKNVTISSSLPSYGQTENKKRVSSNDKVKSLKVMTEQPTGGEILRPDMSNLFLGKNLP